MSTERYRRKDAAFRTGWAKQLSGAPPSNEEVWMAMAVGEHETLLGDVWVDPDGKPENNIGAVQKRTLDAAEKQKLRDNNIVAMDPRIAAGKEMLKRAAQAIGNGRGLHVDSSPGSGWYFVWFWAFDTEAEGVAMFLKILLQDRPLVRQVIGKSLRLVAENMYRTRYYEGIHKPQPQNDEPKDNWKETIDSKGNHLSWNRKEWIRQLPLTRGEEANVKDYTTAITRTYNMIATALGGTVMPKETPMPSKQEDIEFIQIPGESKGARLSRVAVTCKGCSSRVNTDLYIDCVVRKSDRTPESKLNYYLWNGQGDKLPSTCILFYLRQLERAGIVGRKEINDPYVFGQAAADVQHTPGWRWGLPYEEVDVDGKKVKQLRPFKKGDGYFVDDSSQQNSHFELCVTDAVVLPDGSWQVDVMAGGQAPDSTGQEYFTRTLKWGDQWLNPYTGQRDRKLLLGTRWIYGWCDVEAQPIPITANSFPPPPVPIPESTPTPASGEFDIAEPSTHPETPVSKSKNPPAASKTNKPTWIGIIVAIGTAVAAAITYLATLGHC